MRLVVADLGFQLSSPALRQAALSVLDNAYPSESGRIRAQQFWRDRVLEKWRQVHG